MNCLHAIRLKWTSSLNKVHLILKRLIVSAEHSSHYHATLDTLPFYSIYNWTTYVHKWVSYPVALLISYSNQMTRASFFSPSGKKKVPDQLLVLELGDLNDSKLITNESKWFPWSSRTNLVPLFHKLVTGQVLFFYQSL